MPSADLPTSPMANDLRPLTIGELIDRTFQLYRRHFVQLFLFSSLIYSLWFMLGVVMTFLGWDLRSMNGLRNVMMGLLCLPAYLIVFSLMKLGEGALVYFVSELYLGRKPFLREAFAALRNRVWPMLWTTFLKTVIMTLAFLLAFVPLVVIIVRGGHLSWRSVVILLFSILLLLIPGLILAVRYLLTDQAVMLENKSGWLAIRRSTELIRHDPGLGFMYWGETRISIILLVIVVASILIGCVSSIPALISRIPGLMRGNYTAMDMDLPTGVKIVTHLLNFLGSSLVAPLFAIAKTAFYYDARVRKEGFDLELMAGSIAAGKPR
jgi:hypothetical protein